MDFLKRELAPLSAEAWKEIDERAKSVLGTHLTARKVVSVVGPLGWDENAVNDGRLNILEDKKDEVQIGIYQVHPLIEARMSFELDRWEMDNITRGARDADLDSLDDCMRRMALFEEKTIFRGHEKGGIEGLLPSAERDPLSLGKENVEIMQSLSKAVLLLNEAFQESPFTLVVGEEAWRRLHEDCMGYPLRKRVGDLIGGEILYSQGIEGGVLVPHDHEDLELTIGGDFSIGYVSHDSRTVRLFATESFLFRVIDPSIVIPFSV